MIFSLVFLLSLMLTALTMCLSHLSIQSLSLHTSGHVKLVTCWEPQLIKHSLTPLTLPNTRPSWQLNMNVMLMTNAGYFPYSLEALILRLVALTWEMPTRTTRKPSWQTRRKLPTTNYLKNAPVHPTSVSRAVPRNRRKCTGFTRILVTVPLPMPWQLPRKTVPWRLSLTLAICWVSKLSFLPGRPHGRPCTRTPPRCTMTPTGATAK
mmetsp:Transcript_2961/g.4701  ORF Transcript_2961/g.4701 Transcript_2961/m.4701 type:complete len:208 (+) Transcript_2961:564-1187(+)